jgi:pimeloyl-ACP methyl ester carboxylesterase
MTLKLRHLTMPTGQKQAVFAGGQGPNLIWLHGVGGITAEDPVAAALTANFSVFAPVAPGFTDLADLDGLATIHDLVLYYDDLLTLLGVGRVVVAGHSFGAMIAAEIAAHFPDRAASVVLFSPVGLWNDDYPVADLFARPSNEVNDFLWDGAGHRPAEGNGSVATIEEQIEATVMLARGLTAVAKFTCPIPDNGLSRRLHRVKAPTLIVHGERDSFVPVRYADDFVAGLRGSTATKHVLPAAGHMALYEDPVRSTSLIRNFLTPPAGTG